MRKISILEAYREALNYELTNDPETFVIGEDVGIGSTFGLYTGMKDVYGKERIVDTPISEIALSGCAVGAAMNGMRPIVDFQFADFIFCAMDQMANQASKMYYMSDGAFKVPITVCLPVGANRRGAQHAQCVESYFMNVPGIKIVAPSTPYQAKGLLHSAIRDDNPVLVCQHKLLYSIGKKISYDWMEKDIPEDCYGIELGKAKVVRKGTDVTIVASMLMLYRAMEAAEILKKDYGIEAEVIDPQTIKPLDGETIINSVHKTRKLIVVEECPVYGGWGNEVVCEVAEAIDDCKIRRLGCFEAPMPYAAVLENAIIPQVEDIISTAVKMNK